MKLEQQVCSLELAKRLKELGVKQESLFYWFRSMTKVEWRIDTTMEGQKNTDDLSAFTVAELGEMLPSDYISKAGRTISEGYGFFFGDDEAMYSDTEADARGKMLIYLLENKLLQTNTEDK